MNTVADFVEVFNKKLQETKSFDQAFRKAVWFAYLEGFLEGVEDQRQDKQQTIQECKQILRKPNEI